MNIPEKTLEDLEFNHVLNRLAELAKSERIKNYFKTLRPLGDRQKVRYRLMVTNEILGGFEREQRLPFGDFVDITDWLPRLDIDEFVLPTEVCFEIRNQALFIKDIKKFLNKFQEYYPTLSKASLKVEFLKEIVLPIEQVFEPSGEIKDSASPELAKIRKSLLETEDRIRQKFNQTLKQQHSYLDDIRESFVDNVRVLAVKSAYKKQVSGRICGTSKTGSITFIEPTAVASLHRKFQELKLDEKNEIRKIIRALTALLAEFKPEITQYQNFLLHLDLLHAQAKYANQINATLPQIKEDRIIRLKNAYHPILWERSQETKEEVIPQSLTLDTQHRILLISGPNAGGKSLTLKTIGLLQLMIQSGLLIPVHPKSEIGVFQKIYTDIGDNQSIENQLSTYSYRLKQMNFFIRNMDHDTLLLIDEFGTGSDPELGGALAEVFLEDIYEKEVFAVITTHYTNIKVRVEQLEAARNACMLFDERTLQPLYQLEIGQAGSSFTFEVAQKNKIPYSIINRAKKKVEGNTVRLDKTISKLQREKTEISKTKSDLKRLRVQSETRNKDLEDTQAKLEKKLLDFQKLYDQNQKYLNLGKRLDELADEYLEHRSRRKVFGKILKIIETENSKKPKNQQVKKKEEQKTQKEVKKELNKNRPILQAKEKEIIEKSQKIEQNKIESFKPGQRVRIKDSVSVGTIDSIEGQTVSVNYGKFITKISIFEIEKV